ncbi:hypothetical protein BOTBODRAFT_37983 [Botryobasidium botryosum FD-172 SS1]|uniref:C2 domain-containing protein n=1 Tax=Botryobasidium botryosum (strain FD-172 SS1) TaxID=930990 RepID=A0A067M989_BOTB1|nr:hypothetical protein BOTBODRAFT_37983 [Botryobasidium botryosum FD-172 SS1]
MQAVPAEKDLPHRSPILDTSSMAQSSGTANDDGTVPSSTLEQMQIFVLSASNLPPSPRRRADPKAFVVLTASDQQHRTKGAKRSKAPEWGEEFILLGGNNSTLKIELKGVSGLITLSKKFCTEYLIGTTTIRFKELREMQRRAREDNSDYIICEMQAASPSGPRPSVSLRIHLELSAEPERPLDIAVAKVASARQDILDMPTKSVPTGLFDAATSAQKALEDIGSSKEVQTRFEAAISSVAAFVKMVDALADIHPYVKAAWTALSAGYKIAVAQKARDDTLSELLDSMSTALDLVCRFDKTAMHKDDISVILHVAKKTNECALFIQGYTQTKSFALRAIKGAISDSSDEMARFQKDFQILRQNLDTGAILSLTEGLSGINEDLYKINEGVKDVGRNVDRVAQAAFINQLPYADGASWDPEKVCLPDTREALLEDVWQWIKSAETSNAAEILCLTGVAGSGKSAIAHTVAHRCHKEGILASSFFFSRDFEERSHPKKLLSTFARDLTRDHRIREHISLAIESDQSITTASLSRQFPPLISEPCLRYPFDKSTVFVIDALDEGYTIELLKILRHGILQLPGTFRVFLTSREMEAIDIYLPRSAHIRFTTIDIHASANLADICVYVQRGLEDIGGQRNLEEGWPGRELTDKLTSKSEGLFQWASAVLQALENAYNPTRTLEKLLNETKTGLAPEKKMDEIYSKILQACDWDDDDFKRDYDLIMGAVLAAKSPLSVSTLQSFHSAIPDVKELLSRFGALLTGWRDPPTEQPVRILHLSLREFLTTRAHLSHPSAPFAICEKEHSQRLALLCLTVLNEDLRDDTPGVGYLWRDMADTGIPVIDKSEISGQLLYACEFWMAHVTEFEAPMPPNLVELLRTFLSTRLISWLEVSTWMGRFQPTQQLRAWIRKTLPEESDLLNEELRAHLRMALRRNSDRLSVMGRGEDAVAATREEIELARELVKDSPTLVKHSFVLAEALRKFSNQLASLGHREDALASITEAVGIYQHLAHHLPALFIGGLVMSLDSLSNRLADMSHRKDALAVIKEGIEIYRQLTTRDGPTGLNGYLANSLLTLFSQFSALGHRSDALEAAREAVELYRPMAASYPASYNGSLAGALTCLANGLSGLGRPAEALTAVEEAVQLHRELAIDRPARPSPNLALSLHTLSNQLALLGRREDALVASSESVELYRRLADDRPAVFNESLAGSLNNLSPWLLDLGRREEALAAIREAVGLYRSLHANEPLSAHAGGLAGALDTLSFCLSALDEREGALEAIREAMVLYRPLANEYPDASNNNLVELLNTLSIALSGLNHHEEALEAAAEAVEISRLLAQELPAVYNSRLAKYLRRASASLRDLGREDEAMMVEEEADELDPPKDSDT